MSRSERPLEGRQAGIVAVQASRLQNSHQHQRLRALSIYTFSMELKKSASDMSAMDTSKSRNCRWGYSTSRAGHWFLSPFVFDTGIQHHAGPNC